MVEEPSCLLLVYIPNCSAIALRYVDKYKYISFSFHIHTSIGQDISFTLMTFLFLSLCFSFASVYSSLSSMMS
jgi:hypothetical protein